MLISYQSCSYCYVFFNNLLPVTDILDSFLGNLFQQFSQAALPVLSSQNKRDWRAFLFRFIYFADEYQGKIILSEKSNISLLLLKMADFAHDISNSVPYNNIREKYSISSRLSVIHSTISRWLDDGQKETPEELVDYLMGFILTI